MTPGDWAFLLIVDVVLVVMLSVIWYVLACCSQAGGTPGIVLNASVLTVALLVSLVLSSRLQRETPSSTEMFSGGGEEQGEQPLTAASSSPSGIIMEASPADEEVKKAERPITAAFGNLLKRLPPPAPTGGRPTSPSPSSSNSYSPSRAFSPSSSPSSVEKDNNNKRTTDEIDAIFTNWSPLPRPLNIPSDGMTLFYTAFDARSYPGAGTVWNNVAAAPPPSSHTSDESCPAGRARKSLHMSSYNADFSPYAGITLNNNILFGPKSYELGVDGRSSFTFFFMFRPEIMTQSMLTSKDATVEIVRTYANTYSNNGFHVWLDPVSKGAFSTSTGAFKAQFGVLYGASFKMAPAAATTLEPTKVYLMVLTKMGNTLQLHLTSSADNTAVLLAQGVYQQKNDEDVLFSNKELVLNRAANMRGAVFATGFYSRPLSDIERGTLWNHLNWQREVNSPTYLEQERVYEKMRGEVMRFKACPLDAAACRACSGIHDWRNMFDVVQSMDDPCRKALSKFCTDNPGAAPCKRCFDKGSPEFKTLTCTQWRYFLAQDREARVRDLDDLVDDDVKHVCGKYAKQCCPSAKEKACPVCPREEESHPPRERKKDGESSKSCPSKRKTAPLPPPSHSSSSSSSSSEDEVVAKKTKKKAKELEKKEVLRKSKQTSSSSSSSEDDGDKKKHKSKKTVHAKLLVGSMGDDLGQLHSLRSASSSMLLENSRGAADALDGFARDMVGAAEGLGRLPDGGARGGEHRRTMTSDGGKDILSDVKDKLDLEEKKSSYSKKSFLGWMGF